MTLKLEENELLAALLTAQHMAWAYPKERKTDRRYLAGVWRMHYQDVLREFIDLNKAEMGDEQK